MNVGVKGPNISLSEEEVKKQLKLQREKLLAKQRSLGEQNRGKILQAFSVSYPEGMTTRELEEGTGLHRDTIYTHCEGMKKEGLIKKNGKFGKYRLTSQAIGELDIHSLLFASQAMNLFFDFKGLLESDFRYSLMKKEEVQGKDDSEIIQQLDTLRKWIAVYNKFCDNRFCRSIVLNNKNNGITDNQVLKDELGLFEFVIRVGAIITYMMIKGIEYPYSSTIEKEFTNRDQLVWKWIQNTISLQPILRNFTDALPVAKRLNCNKDGNEARYAGPLYEMDPADLRTLKEAYGNVFPEIYNRLENIETDIPRQIKSRTKQLKRFSKIRQSEIRDPNHSKCHGRQITKIQTDVVIEGKKAKLIKLKKCLKCGRLLYVNELAKERN